MDHTPRSDESKAKRRSLGRISGEGSSSAIPPALLVGMSLVGVVCLSIGCLRRGFSWYDVLSATGCMALGIGFVAIGLLEIEWLERIIGIYGEGAETRIGSTTLVLSLQDSPWQQAFSS